MSHSLQAYLLLTLAVLFWSGNVVIARLLHNDISAIALSCGRWWLATLILLPFAWKYLQKDAPILFKHWRYITLMGLLGISLFNTLLYESAQTTTSNNIALIQTTMPAMILVLAVFLYREKPGILALTGVALSISGAVMVIAQGQWSVLSEMNFVRGDLLMMLASLVYACYSVLIRKMPDIHPSSFLGGTFISGSLLLIPFFMWDLTLHALPQVNSTLIYSLLYVAIFPSIMSYLFWNRGVALVGASLSGFFICLIPVFTAVLAAVFLNETLLWYHFAGLVLIVFGFVLFQSRSATITSS
ncbi:MAG: DMT family transporter [Gammaproteobacteria bacterium]|nr:DMT family transporter [Gammaproteobacteria bacterium]